MDKADAGRSGDTVRQRLASCLVILALTSPAHGAVAQRRRVIRLPRRTIAQPCSQQATGLRTRAQAMTRSLRGVISARDAVLRSIPESRASRLIELQSALNSLRATAALVRDEGLKWTVACGSKSSEPQTLQEINAVNGELRAALYTLAYIERSSQPNPTVSSRSLAISRTRRYQSVESCQANVGAYGRCRPQDLNTCQNCCSALAPNAPGRAYCAQGCQTRTAQCTLDSMQCVHAGACRMKPAPPACDHQSCASCCNAKCPGGALCSVACDLKSTECLLAALDRSRPESPSVFRKQ
jgi:hypothetical protein